MGSRVLSFFTLEHAAVVVDLRGRQLDWWALELSAECWPWVNGVCKMLQEADLCL